MVDVLSGNLAEAVSESIANPFIFGDVDPKSARAIDPGADRVAAVPVEDACRLFPGARLIVSNVTGQAPLFSADMHCPFTEIRVELSVSHDAMNPQSPGFAAAVVAGRVAAERVLPQ
jgi:hypothetical protein